MSELETNYLVVVYSCNASVHALYPQGFALPSLPIKSCQGPRPLSRTGAHSLGKLNNNTTVIGTAHAAVFKLHSKF